PVGLPVTVRAGSALRPYRLSRRGCPALTDRPGGFAQKRCLEQCLERVWNAAGRTTIRTVPHTLSWQSPAGALSAATILGRQNGRPTLPDPAAVDRQFQQSALTEVAAGQSVESPRLAEALSLGLIEAHAEGLPVLTNFELPAYRARETFPYLSLRAGRGASSRGNPRGWDAGHSGRRSRSRLRRGR